MRWRSPKTEPCRAPVLRSSHRKRWRNIYSQFAEDFCFVFFFLQRKQKSFQSFEKKKAGTVAGAGVTVSSVVLDNTCML